MVKVRTPRIYQPVTTKNINGDPFPKLGIKAKSLDKEMKLKAGGRGFSK